MDKERELMKKEILKELIFDRLYRCIELGNDGTLAFNKYELNNEDMLYMLKQYDTEKYGVVVEVLNKKVEKTLDDILQEDTKVDG